MEGVTIREGGAIPQKQVAALLLALGRGERVARLDGRLADVLNNSTFVVSAWDGATLVGAARVLSDGIAVALVQHLGVHPAYQGRGIGATCCGAAWRATATPRSWPWSTTRQTRASTPTSTSGLPVWPLSGTPPRYREPPGAHVPCVPCRIQTRPAGLTRLLFSLP